MLMLLAALAADPTAPFDGARLEAGETCSTISMTREGETRTLGTTRQTVERTTENGREALHIVVHQAVGPRTIHDDFVLDAATLRPLRFENQRNGAVHVRATYGADRITGEMVQPDGTTTPIDVPTTGPVWDGNLYGLAFAALPLAEGASFSIPTWHYDKGFGALTVNVTGSETIETPAGPVDAWVLDAGASADQRATYYIGKADHAELGYAGGPFRQTLGGDCSS
jgi:hypothetical protein